MQYSAAMGNQRSVESDSSRTVTAERGQRAHGAHVEHTDRLRRTMYQIGPDAWCLVGNGLSNQTFVRGPEGIIAIDSGESVEEMRAALAELRQHTDEPVVAVLYTHFHYVQGTAAIIAEAGGATLPIWGHERISTNLLRAATEVAPAYGRGLTEQFALAMPADGPDGLVNVGLGLAYRFAEHAPFTPGHITPDRLITGPCVIEVAGLTVHVEPAPSDADDSVTYWFPALGIVVHNIVWPALFNVFAIRGEEYRDPRVLLRGIDHIRSLSADHLIATHGPPMHGAAEIAERVTRYRDSIQFLWDQTVRWTNRGATSNDLAHLVVMPEVYEQDWLTTQLYGVAEHHTRQIRSGLFGFFDGDPKNLFPHAPHDRADRFISSMGGATQVRLLCRTALADDLRWALELAGLLVDATDAGDEDRQLLADALRLVAQRTPAANIRNWCITRALALDGAIDATRHNQHRFHRRQVMAWHTDTAVHVLRVLLDPDLATGIDTHVAVELDGERAGLHFRNHVAATTDGTGATVTLRCTRAVWADVLAGPTTLDDAIAAGTITVDGDAVRALAAFATLDHPSFSTQTTQTAQTAR